jgi:hypothetical protein
VPSQDAVAAHAAAQSHHYIVHFPPHPARASDPHYADFNAYHQANRATARCYIGERIGYGDCMDAQMRPCPPHELAVDASGRPTGAIPPQPGLELHHAIVEFSLQNGVSLTALEHDYPGISDATQVGAWIESDQNFRWLCAFHHRGPAGAHTASHSDWSASQYVQGLITGTAPAGGA